MSDSLQSHRLKPTRLLCPWDSPGKNTRVGSHSLLQEIILTQGLNLGLLYWKAGSLPSQPPGKPNFLVDPIGKWRHFIFYSHWIFMNLESGWQSLKARYKSKTNGVWLLCCEPSGKHVGSSWDKREKRCNLMSKAGLFNIRDVFTGYRKYLLCIKLRMLPRIYR